MKTKHNHKEQSVTEIIPAQRRGYRPCYIVIRTAGVNTKLHTLIKSRWESCSRKVQAVSRLVTDLAPSGLKMEDYPSGLRGRVANSLGRKVRRFKSYILRHLKKEPTDKELERKQFEEELGKMYRLRVRGQSEWETFKIAYNEWYDSLINPVLLDCTFSRYMFEEIVPHYVRHYLRRHR